MQRIYTKDLHEHIGKEILLKGWVDGRRDHGKLVFLDLRDMSGKVQMVALPNHEEAHKTAQEVRPEWVIEVVGQVNSRPERMVNKDEANGDIEIEVLKLHVLNEAATPPFDLSETKDVDENLRLDYRYLDLRSTRMQRNLRLRSEFIRRSREFLFARDFTEIETPLLTESTPEGSRDFVVPSRLHPGKFYALPQSPQQYKQLLMTAGFEKYFQIARALRDEDLRADRGFEHTQIDIETSFVEQDDVMNLVETMITEIVEAMGYVIKAKPFPRISYAEAMEKYGADKFDMRTEEEKGQGILAYAWVVDFPFFEKTDEGGWTFSHNPFSMPKEEHLNDLMTGKNIANILTTQYDLVCNGFESGGGSIRAHRADILEATYRVMGYSEEETQKSVGHMLEAFRYGTPPHGGIALGVERNIMNLTGEEALREVQAFPMTRGGQTAVMKGPSNLQEKQLTELGITAKLVPTEKK
jgi:aspartyl-tRNA synthetase